MTSSPDDPKITPLAKTLDAIGGFRAPMEIVAWGHHPGPGLPRRLGLSSGSPKCRPGSALHVTIKQHLAGMEIAKLVADIPGSDDKKTGTKESDQDGPDAAAILDPARLAAPRIIADLLATTVEEPSGTWRQICVTEVADRAHVTLQAASGSSAAMSFVAWPAVAGLWPEDREAPILVRDFLTAWLNQVKALLGTIRALEMRIALPAPSAHQRLAAAARDEENVKAFWSIIEEERARTRRARRHPLP